MYYVDYRLSKILSQERIEQARRAHRRKHRPPDLRTNIANQPEERVSAPNETKAA
jgi:hypothetical protein